MEVIQKTLVTVIANAFDMDMIESERRQNECEQAKMRDGDLSTWWSCKEDLQGCTNCEITYIYVRGTSRYRSHTYRL